MLLLHVFQEHSNNDWSDNNYINSTSILTYLIPKQSHEVRNFITSIFIIWKWWNLTTVILAYKIVFSTILLFFRTNILWTPSYYLKQLNTHLNYFHTHFSETYEYTHTHTHTHLAALDLSCGTWDLVPWLGIEPRSPALGVSLDPQGSPWTYGYCFIVFVLFVNITVDSCWM